MSAPAHAADPLSRLLAQLRQALERGDLDPARQALDRLEPVVDLLRRSALQGFGEYEQRVGELSLLVQAGTLFQKAFDVAVLCDGLLELVEASCGVRHVAIRLAASEHDLPHAACRGEALSADSAARLDAALRDARDARDGEAGAFVELAPGDEAILHALVSQHQHLGTLVVVDGPREEPARRDLARRLGVLAGFAALAVRHARLMDEHARHRRNLEAVVSERTREVNEARAALSRQERVAALGKLAASIAHEVNDPMSFVLSNLARADEYAQEMSRAIPGIAAALEAARNLPALLDERVTRTRDLARPTPPRGRMLHMADELGSIVAEAREGVDRIRRVGDDLRQFARGVAGVAEPVDVNRLVETALHIVRAAAKHEVVFECRLGRIPEVSCQRYPITQVLLALLQNAVDAVAPGGAVRVTSRVVEAFVEVEVADDGPGLGPGELERIFEPFHTTKPEGSGLGLSLARDIAAAHRGSLEATSGPEGAVFRLRLPI